MSDLDGQEREALDCRSVVILAEPIFAPGQVLWHAMAFVAGENHNDITGSNRAAVLDDCLSSIAERGVEFSFDPGAEAAIAAREEPQTWVCPHGITFSGSSDFISGARNAHDKMCEGFVDPTATTQTIELVTASKIRDGDYIWFDLTREFKVVVGRKQGGYTDIEFYLDDGPDEVLETCFQRGEIVLRLVAAREDTERTCPHCGKLILAPRRSYEIDPAAVCKYGAHTGHY